MAELGEITAKLSADVQSFTDGMARAGTSVQNFQNAAQTATSGTRSFYEGIEQAGIFATGSERGVRRMEFALGSLAAESVGAGHAVGTLMEGLLLAGEGSGVVIAVLGGIAAIAGALKLMNLDTDASRKAMEELEKELDKLGAHGKLVSEQLKLDALQSAVADPFRQQTGSLANIIESWKVLFGGTPMEAQIAGQQMRVNAAAADFNKLLDDRAEKDNEHRLAMEEFIERANQEVTLESAKVDKLLEEKSIVAALNDAYAQTLELTQGGVAATVFRSQVAAQGLDSEGIDNAVAHALDRVQHDLDTDAKDSERQAKEWGSRISAGLVDGITGNLNALGNTLKGVLEAFINKFMVTPFLKELGIFSPSAFGMYVGEMIVAGVGAGFQQANLGPLQMNMHIDASGMPAPMTPFEAARDASWQRVFRESNLVAYSNGHRLPGQT